MILHSLARQTVGHPIFRRIAGHGNAAGATETATLLTEARDLCAEAGARRFAEADMAALRARYGEVTQGLLVAVAMRGASARRLRDWLARAETAVEASRREAQDRDMARRLRHLVDLANVAIMTGARSHLVWADFDAAAREASARD